MTQIRFKTLLIKGLSLPHAAFSCRSFREKLHKLYLFLGIRFVRVKIRDSVIWLDTRDGVLSKHYFLYRDYESFEVSLIEQATKQGMTFVDVGACIGYHTLIGSRCVGDSGHVVAFEPALGNYSLLMRNIRANGAANVCAVNAAAMDYQGTIALYLSQRNFGDHRVYDAKDEREFSEGGRRERISVPCVRVDDVLIEHGLEANVIKMDVQGAEMAVFRGMGKTLANPEVVLFCEFWPYGLRRFGSSPREMLDFLDSLGFAVYEILEKRRRVEPVDPTELMDRFPGLGLANLVCFHRASSGSRLFAPHTERVS